MTETKVVKFTEQSQTKFQESLIYQEKLRDRCWRLVSLCPIWGANSLSPWSVIFLQLMEMKIWWLRKGENSSNKPEQNSQNRFLLIEVERQMLKIDESLSNLQSEFLETLICDFRTPNGDENVIWYDQKKKEKKKEICFSISYNSRQRTWEICRPKSKILLRNAYLPSEAERQMLEIDESFPNLHS